MKLTGYNTWKGLVIHIKKGEHLAKPAIIGYIYRPPRDLIEKYREFIDKFNPILNRLEANNCDVTLTGDFNIDLLKINEKQIIGEYFDIFTNHSLLPKITVPTRLYMENGTLIDNMFCKLTEYTLDTTFGILIFSDHQPYFTLLNNCTLQNKSPTYVTINKQDATSTQNFQDDLLQSI